MISGNNYVPVCGFCGRFFASKKTEVDSVVKASTLPDFSQKNRFNYGIKESNSQNKKSVFIGVVPDIKTTSKMLSYLVNKFILWYNP